MAMENSFPKHLVAWVEWEEVREAALEAQWGSAEAFCSRASNKGVVASLNGHEVKLVKFCGVFPWHTQLNEDEMFLVWRGSMILEFRDKTISLDAGELCVVPRNVEHRTVASSEAEVIVFEPAATRNTGDVVDEHFARRANDKLDLG